LINFDLGTGAEYTNVGTGITGAVQTQHVA
jgi:hypothetical protein